MSAPTLAHVLLAAAAAGTATFVNAVAGGGTFLAFPVMTGIAGLTEKAANVSCTLGLWPGSAASVLSVRRSVQQLPRRMTAAYSIIGLVGGAIGAELLVHTSDRSFYLAIPWLLLLATVVFALGDRLVRWTGRAVHDVAVGDHPGRHPTWIVVVGAVQLVLSVYGGYFGAGMGLLMLAGLSLVGISDVRQLNVLKVLMATAVNLSAAVVFLTGPVDWRFVAPMAVAGAAGGFAGMRIAQRLPRWLLRRVILTVAVGLTVAYFAKVYG